MLKRNKAILLIDMQCNIDARGRRARIISGLACCGAGLILALIAYFKFEIFSWPGGIAAILLIGGFFQIFEGKKGWCAARAMGIKTRI